MDKGDSIYAALFRYTKALSAALGLRDVSTQLHSERVLGLATEIGLQLGLASYDMGILKIAASFHDIGKIGIPDHILLKPTRFDGDEWERMKGHCAMGATILGATNIEGSAQAAWVIRHHHENFNGKGYPDNLSGQNIPIQSRVISIADNYDAMAQARAYHAPKPHREIMRIMHRDSGEKHDPQLMQLFDRLIEQSPFKTSDRHSLGNA